MFALLKNEDFLSPNTSHGVISVFLLISWLSLKWLSHLLHTYLLSSSCFFLERNPLLFYHIQVTKIERHWIDFISSFLVFSLISELDASCFLSVFPSLLPKKKKYSSQSHALTGSTPVICG